MTDEFVQKYDDSSSDDIIPISPQLKLLNDFDYDFEMQTIYFITDSTYIYSLNIITKDTKLLLKSANEIHHLAVDWVTKKIYFTDNRNRISVINNDGSMLKVLFQRKIATLRGIRVSPRHGYLFFADAGDDKKIERANMDGSNNMVVVNSDIGLLSSISVDPLDDLIYWADVWEGKIEMINMDGTGREVIMEIPRNIWGAISSLAVFKEEVFLTSSGSNQDNVEAGIFRCNRTVLETTQDWFNCSMIIKGLPFYSAAKPFGKGSQESIQSPCRYKKGGCSQLCLLKPLEEKKRYACACPTGYKLLEDGASCSTSFSKFLVFATRLDLRVVSLDVQNKVDSILPVEVYKNMKAVDYDPVDKMIYWTDDLSYGVILRTFVNGSVVETVIPKGYTKPDHLAIDWIARNLYWTCPEYKKIYVSRLNGSSSKVIISEDLEEPRDIVVDPGDGRLYWSDWGEENPKIESANLDGTNRTTLVSQDIKWPNGVALDYKRRFLYWIDGGTSKIEYYSLTEKKRYKLEVGSPHGFGISILGDVIYWTDRQQRTLYQWDVNTKLQEETIYNVPDIKGIKAVDTNLKYGDNPCGKNNFDCSHLCFYKPSHGAYCSCPPGYYLRGNKKDCNAIDGYLLCSTHTSINMIWMDSPETSPTPKVLDIGITHIATLSQMKRVLWVEESEDGNPASSAIRSAPLNGSAVKDVIQTGFSSHIGGIAVDWLSKNVYWSQQKLRRIEVSRLDGSYKRIVVNDIGGMITKIAIDPTIGQMYWLQSNKGETYSVYRAQLDGSSPQPLSTFKEKPFGLAVDVATNRVYWLTEKFIATVLWDGSQNKTIYSTKATSTGGGLVLFKDHLYLCEIEPVLLKPTVASIHKETGIKKTINTKITFSNLCHDISVYHSSLQKGTNVCTYDNGGCEQLCFPSNMTSRTCGCQSHFTLNVNDNTTCLGPKTFLLVSQKNSIVRYSLADKSNIAVNLKSVHPDIGMARYNLKTQTIYWIDYNQNGIFYQSSKGEIRPLDLCDPYARPVKFTIDFLSNTLYWSNDTNPAISYVRLDADWTLNASARCGIVFQNSNFYPTKLIAVPERGLMVFFNERSRSVNPTEPFNTLEIISMDGTNHRMLVNFTNLFRYDITVDASKERVYWLHSREKIHINTISLKGTDLKMSFELNPEQVEVLNVAVLDDTMFWIDRGKANGRDEYLKWRTLLPTPDKGMAPIYSNKDWDYSGTKDLVAVQQDRFNELHPCNINNGGCSHLCYSVSMTPLLSKCGCPLGYGFVDKDKKRCQELREADCFVRCNGRCQKNATCSELKPCFDENLDCSLCVGVNFQCFTGSCVVHQSRICDGKKNCLHGEDEQNCPTPPVPPSTTTIPTTTEPIMYITEHRTSIYTEYTAGIVSGAILTSFVFICALYFACRLRQKKAAMLNSAKTENLLREAASFKVTHSNKETVNILTQKQLQENSSGLITDSVFTDSYASSSDLSRLQQRITKQPSFSMRYVTGSSTNVTDTNVAPPYNPPPTIASSDGISLASINEYTHPDDVITDEEDDDVISEISKLTLGYIPAPPATPIYCPSEVDSCLVSAMDSVSVCQDNEPHRPYTRTNDLYDRRRRKTSRADSRSCSCDDHSAMSGFSQSTNHRPSVPPCSECSYCSTSDIYLPMGGRLKPPSSYHPPSMVSEESAYTSRTLPRHLRPGSSRPLLPSLASGISRCSSETSIVTVRHKDELPFVNENDMTGNYYNEYGPPPSPGGPSSPVEFPPDMNNFEDFVEEEALENDILMEPPR
ncbi:low-density lipoprotein receptor-related protein 6-like [Clytia hemisphaerica]